MFCQDCGQEGSYLCPGCKTKLLAPPPLGKNFLVAASYEESPIQRLLWNFKYNSVAEIAPVLGELLIDYIRAHSLLFELRDCLVVPVPLHQRRQRARGFNQAGLLAQNVCQKLALQYAPILKRTKNTKSQVELKRQKRLLNVQGVFALCSPTDLSGKKILLIDDVAATGATLGECAKVLQSAGAAKIWKLVVARN